MNPNEKNKIHYIERLNKVFDYIDENIDAQLNLDDLAKVSHFSKFHFSRIFSALVGETPFKFIQRIRLERANYLLRLKPKAKITEIAFECGFNDLAVFSRQFTLHFNISPTAFKKQNIQQSNIHQTSSFKAKYFCSELKIYRDMEQLVEANIRSLPEKTIAYIKHIGRSEEHTSELQSRPHLVCRLLLEKKKNKKEKNEAPEDDKNLNRSTPIGISTNTYITKIFARCTVKSLVIIMPYVTRDASMMCSRP